MDFKSCTKTFNKIADKKKHLVLETAINEFANKGFNSANINVIAAQADVSVGAMYKYFDNKRSLYLTCVEWSMSHLNKKIEEVVHRHDDFIEMLEDLIRTIQKHKKDNQSFTKLYYEMATESNADYSMLISSQIEGITSNLYAAYIDNAKKADMIRQDIDSRYFAFFLDNILMMLQFSYSCEYYIDRMKIYTYDNVLDDDEMLVEQVMHFIKGALFYNKNS